MKIKKRKFSFIRFFLLLSVTAEKEQHTNELIVRRENNNRNELNLSENKILKQKGHSTNDFQFIFFALYLLLSVLILIT